MKKQHILKNLASLAFGHFLVFTAFDSLSNLQSTVNQSDGVGVASQSVIYACFTISSFFLPTYLIKRFGCKKTLLISVFSVCPYIAANFYPTWGTLIPSAMLSGMAFGPLWAARSTYVNELSFQFSSYSKASISVINAWFFGVYSFFHENAEVWGNVISYYVLKEADNGTEIAVPDETLMQCGINFCGRSPDVANPNLKPPTEEKRYILTGIYFTLVVIAGFVILFIVDPLEESPCEDNNQSNKKKPRLSANLLIATLKHMKNKDQLLLIPLSFYCGLADGFYNSDFTKSYIACAWGISQVGHVTICYGVVSAVMDCSSGLLVKWLTRVPVFILAASAHLVMFIILLLWQPQSDNYALYFILSGVYGIGASVWWSQIIAFYGVIFKENEEPAFSNFYFWSSLGFSVAYAYSDVLCTAVKIYILIALLLLAIATYIGVEFQHTCSKTERNRNILQLERTIHIMEHLWKLRLLKSVTRTLRIKSIQNFHSTSCTRLLHSSFVQKQPQISLPVTFQVRSYAKNVQGKKGGKQKLVKLSDEEMAEIIDVAEYKAQLQAAVDKLKKNYVENLNLRWTGSNVGNLRVKLQDEEFALHELARISRKNTQLVVLNMSEFPEVIKHVIQAINESGSEMNPQQEGTMIYLTIPKLSRDTREVLAKNAKRMCNKAKEEIRDLQNHYIKIAKSKADLSEDLIFNATNQIMALSDGAMDQLRVVLMTKQHDILGDNEGSL